MVITIFLGVVLILMIIGLLIHSAKNDFKVGYYEQKLKNHKSKFTDEEWKNIEKIINK